MENNLNKKHKKNVLLALITVFIVALVLSNFVLKESYASTISRVKMQDAVVSTAMAYLNNKTSSDYCQKTMDNKGTYYWRQFTNTPEMVSSTNFYYIDCSSFVSSVYMHSLGYDFSDYYEYASGNKYYNKFTAVSVTTEPRFRKMYKKIGLGLSTSYFHKIASTHAAEVQGLTEMPAGKEYINDSNTNKSIVAYYYRVSGNETETEKDKIRTNIKNTLKPGDILVYRNKSETSTGGHAMMYVGSAIDSRGSATDSSVKGGFIHSIGSDYVINTDSITIGNDDFSVSYEGIGRIINNKIFNSSSTSYAFVILRPINKFCTKDSCVVPECAPEDNCPFAQSSGNMNKNVDARIELAKLRIDQYPNITKSYNDNLTVNDVKPKKYEKSLSKYNSVNQGDQIDYILDLENRSQIEFCLENGADNYATKTKCEKANYTWTTSDQDKIVYKNLTITNVVPEGTKFVSCDNSYCSYNQTTRTVTWNLPSIEDKDTLSYTVKVTGSTDIVNEGMKITTESGSVLQLASITTKVNPTMNSINMDLMNKEIEKFDQLVKDEKITYDSSSATYKVDYDSITSANISHHGFVRSLYYNTLGMDIGYVKSESIKQAIFHNSENNYAKKTDDEVKALTDTNDININKMLVKGMYGGRYLRTNDNEDRANYIRLADFEYGDIIVTFYTSDSVAQYILMSVFLGVDSDGKPKLVRFKNDTGITIYDESATYGKTASKMLKEIYAEDLFVVLRPTQLYGTTVKLNYNGATTTGDNSYVAYDVYRNLNTPKKDSYITTLNYNKTVGSGYPTSLTSTNTFNGWYSDTSLTNKVTNTTKLTSTDSHTLNAKWTTASQTLPSPTVTGYKLEGWYKNSDLTTKAGNPGASYTPTSTSTLYANWDSITYQVKYDSNGGTGTMANSAHTYDVSKALNENKYTKEGYTFSGWATSANATTTTYNDKQNVINLSSTEGEIITLYAVWTKIDADTVPVNVIVTNGTISGQANKTVDYNTTTTFTINANKGYSSPDVSCTNNQTASISGNTLTTGNITNETTCTVTYKANTYQIKYNSNGGTGTMANSTHTYDVSKELATKAFTRTGYTFEGWSKTQTGNVEYIDKETVKNLTEENNGIVNLYAVWKPVTYKIKYNLDGGSTVNPETYTIETPTFKLNNPSKEGYKFIGWTTNADSDKKLEVEIIKGTTGDKEYTANYEISKYNVTYKSDENGSITGKEVEEILYQNNPSGTTQEAKEGYEDLKWAVDKDVELKDGTIINKGESITKEQIQNIVVKEDITITIYHYQIKYNVSYESSEDGKVEQSNEEVAQNANPLGVKISPNKGYKLSYFIADKDVELKDGTVIKQGEEITEEELLEIVIKEDIKLKAMYEVATYIVKYESGENGNITGITSEEILYQNSPLGTIVIPNKNYEVLSWVADKDVELKDGTVIKQGEKITEEQIKEIKVESDLVLTVKYIKTVHTVYYKSDNTINIIGILKEEVRNLSSPVGTEVKAQDVNSYIVWIANKDVELKDGTILKVGEEITEKELSNILVKEDLILTAYAKNNVKVEVPNTGSVRSIVAIGLGITLVVGGIYFVHNRKKEIS